MPQLVVSFVGNTDLKGLDVIPRGANWESEDQSPILRLILHLANNGLFESGSRVLLFDDHPEDDNRRTFAARLREQLQRYRLDASVAVQAIVEADGPTDYDALFESTWQHLPHGTDMRQTEVCVHLSSGAPAMHSTLLLAALCLPLESVRLFETSKEKQCREVRLPYVLAIRRRRARQVAPRQASLPPQALKSLLPHTVLKDPEAHLQFAALYGAFKTSVKSRSAPRIVIAGPTGSGKAHAARQFAAWADRELVAWSLDVLDQPSMPEIPENAVILLRHIEHAEPRQLERLRSWSEASPETAWVVTWRTDRAGEAELERLRADALPGAVDILLPSLETRSDIVELAEALARQLGLWDTKIKERLQHQVFDEAITPLGLHSLQSLIATAGAHSKSRHIDESAFDAACRTRSAIESAEILRRAGELLAGLNLRAGLTLDDVLSGIRFAALQLALAGGRTQAQAAELLYCKQQTLSEWLKRDDVAFQKLARYLDHDD